MRVPRLLFHYSLLNHSILLSDDNLAGAGDVEAGSQRAYLLGGSALQHAHTGGGVYVDRSVGIDGDIGDAVGINDGDCYSGGAAATAEVGCHAQ